MSAKAKKIINIVVDAIVTVILVFVVILAVSAITSKSKGYKNYTEIFGKAYLAVESNSMVGSGSDNFSKGDLITIKVLSSTSEKRSLKEGDVVTFIYKTENDQYILNSHRIVQVNKNQGGEVVSYYTHGDNNPALDANDITKNTELVEVSKVVGVFQGKASGIGWMFIYMSTSAGFFVCIVLPSLLIVVYFAVNLILVIRKEKKVQTAAADEEKQQELDKEREKMRAELLAELAAEKNAEKNGKEGGNENVEDGNPSDTKPE